MEEERELGSPLAVAAFDAVRALVWQTSRYDAVPADDLARELEKAAEDVSPSAAEMLRTLAATARMAKRNP
jgi:hypothetical protein